MAASCSIEPELTENLSGRKETIEVKAVMGRSADTKLSFSEAADRVEVKWKESGEVFTAFIGSGETEAVEFSQTGKPDASGTVLFRGEIPAATSDDAQAYAIYPRVHSSTGNPKSLTLDLAVQTGVHNEYHTFMYASASVSDLRNNCGNLAFRHLTSTLKLTLNFGSETAGNVNDVTFSSEGLVRNAKVDLTADTPVVTAGDKGAVSLIRTFEISGGKIDVYLYLLPADLGEISISAMVGDEYYTGVLGGKSVVSGKQYHATVDMTPLRMAEYKGVVLGMQQFTGNDKHFLNTSENKVYQTSECAANCAKIDMVSLYASGDNTGYGIFSPNVDNVSAVYSEAYMTGKGLDKSNAATNWAKRNETLFKRLTSAEINGTKFNALATTDDLKNLYEDVAASIETTKRVFKLKLWESVAFKTADGRYGVFMVTALSGEKVGSVTIKYKISDPKPAAIVSGNVSKVTVEKDGGKWRLMRNGESLYVKGAATNEFYGDLSRFGGNTIRIYAAKAGDPEVAAILDEAYMNGLYVNVGLYVGAEKNGFDYNDSGKVQEQLEAARASVMEYKNHPAVLFWSVGNEAESSYTNVKLWDAINGIVEMIHEVDPNHPVTTTLASANSSHISYLLSKCPSLDFLCVNAYYPTVLTTCGKVKEYGWTKPLMITEYGPRGTWGMNPEPNRILPWDGPTAGKGALVEETSTEKEAKYLEIYRDAIAANDDMCIGSFAFVWGYQKHGEVLNWYGLFNKAGYSYGAVDALQYCWTGAYPAHRAPVIATRNAMTMNGKVAEDAIKVKKNSQNTAKVVASSPCGAALRYEWVLFKEGAKAPDGSLPNTLVGYIADPTKAEISLKAPPIAGAFRLYVFVLDDANKKVASACIPFKVE